MNILRRIALSLLAALLPFLLFAIAFDYWVINTASHPATIKKLVADSGIYSNFISASLEQAQQQSGQDNLVSLIDPSVKSSAAQVFTPQFLRQTTENVIDGTYDWLDGKVAQPDFKIDLSGKKTDFAALVAGHAEDVASRLPACSLRQPLPNPSNFDVFKAACLPPNISPRQVRDQVKQAVLSNDNFLKDPVVTAADLKDSKTGQPVFQKENIKKIPGYYQWAKRTPVVLSLLAILAITGIVFLSSARLSGLRRVGMVLLAVGILMMIFAYGFSHADLQDRVKLKGANYQVMNSLRAVIKDLTDMLGKNYWFFGGLYTVLGAVAFGGAVLSQRRTKTDRLSDISGGRHLPKR